MWLVACGVWGLSGRSHGPRATGYKPRDDLSHPIFTRPRQRPIELPDDAAGEPETSRVDQQLALKVRLELLENEDRFAMSEEPVDLGGREGNRRRRVQDRDIAPREPCRGECFVDVRRRRPDHGDAESALLAKRQTVQAALVKPPLGCGEPFEKALCWPRQIAAPAFV